MNTINFLEDLIFHSDTDSKLLVDLIRILFNYKHPASLIPHN